VDCDDQNPDIHPLAVEIPDNGVDEDCDGIDLTTYVIEPNLDAFTVFPNPASEFIYFSDDVPGVHQVELYDVTGQLLFRQTGIEPMDVSIFPSGIYLLKIIASPERNVYTIKLALVK
jgi:hypothetical protein